MRKRIEEELAKLAFGEIEGANAQELERQAKADPEAGRTYETYRRMKEELRSLSDAVPADQLSKERLREAILTRGLSEKHASTQRGSWIWLPMAAALAFGVFFAKGYWPSNSGNGSVVVDTTGVSSIPPLADVRIDRPDPVAAVTPAPRTEVLSPKPATQVAADTTRGSRVSRGRRAMASRIEVVDDVSLADGIASLPTYDSLDNGDSSPAIVASLSFGESRGADAAPAALAAPSAPRVHSPTIVVIQSETDANTGTLRATEVENTSNVVVGG